MQSGLAVIAYLLVNAGAALGGYETAILTLLSLAAVSLLVDVWGSMCNDLLLAQERMLASSVVSVAHIALLITLAALALALGYGLPGVYVATIAAGLLRAAALWGLQLRGGVRPAWPFDWQIARPLLLNGAPLALSAFLALAYQHADKLMSARLLGPEQTGYLTAAFVIIFGVIELLNTTILIAVYPLMARYTGDTFGFIVEKLSFFTLMIAVPIALVLSIFSAEITVPLFGPDFAPTADVLRILIWYAAVAMTVNVFAQAMVVQNRQRRLLILRACGLGDQYPAERHPDPASAGDGRGDGFAGGGTAGAGLAAAQFSGGGLGLAARLPPAAAAAGAGRGGGAGDAAAGRAASAAGSCDRAAALRGRRDGRAGAGAGRLGPDLPAGGGHARRRPAAQILAA